MADEETSKPTEQRPEVVDPHKVPVVFVDWFVTCGQAEGVVNLALGTIDHSMKVTDDELPRVVVGARLRLSHQFALRLHGVLGEILGVSGSDPQSEPAPNPPKNLIN